MTFFVSEDGKQQDKRNIIHAERSNSKQNNPENKSQTQLVRLSKLVSQPPEKDKKTRQTDRV